MHRILELTEKYGLPLELVSRDRYCRLLVTETTATTWSGTVHTLRNPTRNNEPYVGTRKDLDPNLDAICTK